MTSSLNMAEQLLKMAQQAAERDQRPEAFRLLHRLLSMREIPRPVAEQGHALLGEMLLNEGQYHRARRSLSVALAYNPSSPYYHFLTGRCHDWDDEGDDSEAINHYRVATELAPDQAAFHSAYGLLLTYMDRGVQGKAHLSRAVQIDSTNPEIRYNYCVGLLNCGDYDLAEQEARTMLAAKPNDVAFQQVLEELNRLRQVASTGAPVMIGLRDQVIPWPFLERSRRSSPVSHSADSDPERLHHLSTRSHVKPAVAKLPASQVRQVATQLGLQSDGPVSECRARVVDALRQAPTLARAVAALDDVARDALHHIMQQDGWHDAEALARRFETKPCEPAWHACWNSPSPLAPLRHWGLVHVGRVSDAGRVRVGAVIPIEVRDLLSSMLASDE